tara:strand:+ start:2232 stop:2657 length:426 start_codon:yes stop_codon:yes gene_type:complete
MGLVIEELINSMYRPKYLISMRDFTINCYVHHTDCENATERNRHSSSCYGYALFLLTRTHKGLFIPCRPNGDVIVESDSDYDYAVLMLRFKNFGMYDELANGYSRIVFNNGAILMFDPEGYAGDSSVEDLLGLTDKLELVQ